VQYAQKEVQYAHRSIYKSVSPFYAHHRCLSHVQSSFTSHYMLHKISIRSGPLNKLKQTR
jgi:hypothetical protein